VDSRSLGQGLLRPSTPKSKLPYIGSEDRPPIGWFPGRGSKLAGPGRVSPHGPREAAWRLYVYRLWV